MGDFLYESLLSFDDLWRRISEESWRHGINTAAKIADPRVMTVKVTDDEIIAHLVDGRTISVPLVWSWRLVSATEKQRQHWQILGDGQGVHWPDIDEDISVNGMLYGMPAHRPRERACAR